MSGSRTPRMPSARLTSATNTTNRATMLIRRAMPASVPLVMASMLERAVSAGPSSPAVAGPTDGTMTAAMRSAPGVLMSEAVRMCPMASGTTSPRMLAYRTMTVPAMVAMPQLMSENSSPRLKAPR